MAPITLSSTANSTYEQKNICAKEEHKGSLDKPDQDIDQQYLCPRVRTVPPTDAFNVCPISGFCGLDDPPCINRFTSADDLLHLTTSCRERENQPIPKTGSLTNGMVIAEQDKSTIESSKFTNVKIFSNTLFNRIFSNAQRNICPREDSNFTPGTEPYYFCPISVTGFCADDKPPCSSISNDAKLTSNINPDPEGVNRW